MCYRSDRGSLYCGCMVLDALVSGALSFQGLTYSEVYDCVMFGKYFVPSFGVCMSAKYDICIALME